MDAFTGDATKIGLPVYERGAMYQQQVANLDVVGSANANVTAGTGILTGNIEFWPQNYVEQTVLANIGGLSSVHDWNDMPNASDSGVYSVLAIGPAGDSTLGAAAQLRVICPGTLLLVR